MCCNRHVVGDSELNPTACTMPHKALAWGFARATPYQKGLASFQGLAWQQHSSLAASPAAGPAACPPTSPAAGTTANPAVHTHTPVLGSMPGSNATNMLQLHGFRVQCEVQYLIQACCLKMVCMCSSHRLISKQLMLCKLAIVIAWLASPVRVQGSGWIYITEIFVRP